MNPDRLILEQECKHGLMGHPWLAREDGMHYDEDNCSGGSRREVEAEKIWWCETHQYMAPPAAKSPLLGCYYQRINRSDNPDSPVRDGTCRMVSSLRIPLSALRIADPGEEV